MSYYSRIDIIKKFGQYTQIHKCQLRTFSHFKHVSLQPTNDFFMLFTHGHILIILRKL
jgi:hypothetical protein